MWRTVARRHLPANRFSIRAQDAEINLIAFAVLWIATAGCYQANGDWEWERFASHGQQDIRYSSLISLICSLSVSIDCEIEVERRTFFQLPLLTYFRLRRIIIFRTLRVSEFGSAIDYWLFGSSNALRFSTRRSFIAKAYFSFFFYF